MSASNPIGLRGITCVELAAPPGTDDTSLRDLLKALGFSRTHRHETQAVDLYTQNEIRFLVTAEEDSYAKRFASAHGPSISSVGWLVEDASEAIVAAIARGAVRHVGPTPFGDAPAIVGIGGSLIYFLEASWLETFLSLDSPDRVPSRGFTRIDHLTNNVEKGTLETWSLFYKETFGFTEVRTFDIRGEKTGLTSYALRSPDGSFCIPINEGAEEKSQIEEYLREYHGPGIQHLAFLTEDLLSSLAGLKDAGVETLDIDDEYYDAVFDRVPGVLESPERIRELQVLVDGDDAGYLLQIFTKNLIGPIFFEMIQRRNHLSFGEGNFGALFRSIERDQERRGTI